LYWVSILF
jgi:Na+/alanine symporter